MKVRAIDKQTLLLLLEMGKSSYPNEYMVLLEEENGIINNTFMTNGSTSEDSANIFTDMIPLGMKFAGTAHSHPIPPGYGDSPSVREHMLHPSDQDLSTFCAIGNVHIIVSNPFDETSWRAYNREGDRIHLEVTES